MEVSEKLEAYFNEEHPFKKGINLLRTLTLKTNAVETVKWGSPVYTTDGKNVFWIAKFKNHFGLGFFNGVFLKDSQNILVNVQEEKMQAMRHWKFNSIQEIIPITVVAYMNEAIENQKKGLRLIPEKKKKTTLIIPEILQTFLEKDSIAKTAFDLLSPYKQKEYAEYISTAKQEKTKRLRLDKIAPVIIAEKGLNDKYRNC